MTNPVMAERMAQVHRRAYASQGRCWTTQEFAALLSDPNVVTQWSDAAFALARVAVDEAELLMIACDPGQQRQGQASRILSDLEHDLRARSADKLFLEVAEHNRAALALYDKAGFREITRRFGYYGKPDGSTCDAVVMQKDLQADQR